MMPGETIFTGASPKCNDCGVETILQVCKSGAGYYLGTYCNCGPYSRETGYYETKEIARHLLETNSWEPRR